MAIHFSCTKCGHGMTAPESAAERIAACSECGQHLMVPQESQPPPQKSPSVRESALQTSRISASESAATNDPDDDGDAEAVVFKEYPSLADRRRALRTRKYLKRGAIVALLLLLLLLQSYLVSSLLLPNVDAAPDHKPAQVPLPEPARVADGVVAPVEAEGRNREAIEALKEIAWRIACEEVQARKPMLGKLINQPNVEVVAVNDDGTIQFLCKGKFPAENRPGIRMSREFAVRLTYFEKVSDWHIDSFSTSTFQQGEQQENWRGFGPPDTPPGRVVGSWRGVGNETVKKFEIKKGPWYIDYQIPRLRMRRGWADMPIDLVVRDQNGAEVATKHSANPLGMTGRFTIEQAGTFTIEVRSSAGWTLTVNESK